MHAQSCIGIRANREFLPKKFTQRIPFALLHMCQNQSMGGCLTVPTFRMCLAMKEESLRVARDREARVS